METQTNTPSSPQATPVEKFGKDHWSLLAYVECCCVDGRDGAGQLELRRLRNKEDNAPGRWRLKHSTRLKGYFDFVDRDDPEKAIEAGLQLRDHDDIDCLGDLEAAGFIDVVSRANLFVKMTAEGVAAAHQLRRHKIDGGSLSDFAFDSYAAVSLGRGAENNLRMFSHVFMRIRSWAQEAEQERANPDLVAAHLRSIKIVSDALHNVGSDMAKGKSIDLCEIYAQSLKASK